MTEPTKHNLDAYELTYSDGRQSMVIDGTEYPGHSADEARALLIGAFTTEAEGEPAYMTTREVCAVFRISRRTLYLWNKEGRVSPVKVGRDNLYLRSDIEALTKTGIRPWYNPMSDNNE